MYSAVTERQGEFTPLIENHWPNLLSSMKFIYEYHRDGRMKKTSDEDGTDVSHLRGNPSPNEGQSRVRSNEEAGGASKILVDTLAVWRSSHQR